MLVALPVFSAQIFPARLRVGLAAVLAFLIAPSLPETHTESLSLWSLIHLLFMEVSVGALLGFVCRLIFFALDIAGGIVSTDIGLTLPSEFSQFTGASSMAPAVLLYWMGVMLLFSLDMHHWLLVSLQRTYALLPVGGAQLHSALFNDVISRTSHLFLVAVLMAAPMIATSFLLNLIMAVLGRAVPQMNVFTESFAFRALAGLTVFGLTLNLMAQHILNYLRRLPEDVLHVAQLLGAH
jgi:flagellar biosynthetic protein FliR